MKAAPLLSVVIPVYNAAASLAALHAALHRTLAPLAFRGGYEMVFVDDASRDAGFAVLQRLAASDPTVRAVALAENRGQQEATLHGLDLAAGEYLATMDDDGQHPPELLPRMLDMLWRDTLDIVYAVPRGRRETALRSVGGAMRDLLFSRLFPHLGDTRVSAYRVMTRALARRVLDSRSAFNYFSAMVFQEPVRAAVLEYSFAARRIGRSGYTVCALAGLYWNIFRHYGPFGEHQKTPHRPCVEKERVGFVREV